MFSDHVLSLLVVKKDRIQCRCVDVDVHFYISGSQSYTSPVCSKLRGHWPQTPLSAEFNDSLLDLYSDVRLNAHRYNNHMDLRSFCRSQFFTDFFPILNTEV